MNKAQKRACLRLLISVATLLIASIVIIYIRSSGINIVDFSTQARIIRYILFGILSAIPLILIVVTEWDWKKVYDERDKQIDCQAVILGTIGAFIFLSGAGWFLTVDSKMGSIKAPLIILLVYLACFVWTLVLSIAALIQYGPRYKGEKS